MIQEAPESKILYILNVKCYQCATNQVIMWFRKSLQRDNTTGGEVFFLLCHDIFNGHPPLSSIRRSLHPTNQNIVDGNVNDLDEEANEPHDQETNPRGSCHMRELLSVWLRALHHEVLTVSDELS